MAKMEVVGKKVNITGMKVAGGKLPKGFEVKLNVVLSFETASVETILKYAAGGQSARVALQTKLRELPTSKLNELAKKTTEIDVNALDQPANIFMSPAEIMASMLEKMTPEQKVILRKQLEKN